MTMNVTPAPDNLRKTTLYIYIAYLVSVVIGVTGLIGLIAAYIKRPDARGTMLESHYDNIIKTFWLTVIMAVIGLILTFVFIGIFVLLAAGVIFLWRTIKGLMELNDGKPYSGTGMFLGNGPLIGRAKV